MVEAMNRSGGTYQKKQCNDYTSVDSRGRSRHDDVTVVLFKTVLLNDSKCFNF